MVLQAQSRRFRDVDRGVLREFLLDALSLVSIHTLPWTQESLLQKDQQST